ncbi:MAG: MFS transporter [Promethearchaeota archaeon]
MTQSRLLPIYSSVFVWYLGLSLVNPFTSIWLRQVIGETSFLRLGLVISFPILFSLIGILGTSQLTDRFGYYRETLMIINLVGMIQYLTLTQISHAFEYLIIVGLASLLFPAYVTLILALATNVCDPNDKGKVTNNIMLFASAGFFLGSLFAGNGYKELGMEAMLFFAAVFIAVSGLIIMFAPESPHLEKLAVVVPYNHIKIPQIHFEASKDTQTLHSGSSLINIIKRRQIILILLSIIILDFSSGAFFMFGSIWLNERANLEYEWIGYANGAATLIACFLLLWLGGLIDNVGRKPVFTFGLISYPLVYIAFSFFHQPWIVFLLWCIPLYAFLRPTANAMIADLTLEHERSRGMSLLMISSNLAITIGAFYGGLVADTYELAMDFWTLFPAILAWFAVFVGYSFVSETLTTKIPENQT